MPYFVFRSQASSACPNASPRHPAIAKPGDPARLRARESGDAAPIRMVFAANEIEAADLLTQPREPDPSLCGADA